MAKEVFERTKPHVNVGTIGHIDHGKTTLTASILAVQAAKGLAKIRPTPISPRGNGPRRNEDRDDRRLARRVRVPESALCPHRLPGPRRLHQEHDHRCRPDGRRDPRRLRGDGPMPQTREHILLRAVRSTCRRRSCSSTSATSSTTPELLELVEMDVRELLTKYDFPGDDIPVIRGSAKPALDNPRTTRPMRASAS